MADIARKKHNERIESRTQEEIKEEESLVAELKRIEVCTPTPSHIGARACSFIVSHAT